MVFINIDNLIVIGDKLLTTDDLNNTSLFKGSITTYQISGNIPKNAPSGATAYGILICISNNRQTQLYIDYALGLKSRVWYSDTISKWL